MHFNALDNRSVEFMYVCLPLAGTKSGALNLLMCHLPTCVTFHYIHKPLRVFWQKCSGFKYTSESVDCRISAHSCAVGQLIWKL